MAVVVLLSVVSALGLASTAEIIVGTVVQTCELILCSEMAGTLVDVSIVLTEMSPWNLLVVSILGSVAGLWAYGCYLEFDRNWTKFALTLWSFLLAVWFVVGTGATACFSLLLAWEIVGMVSFSLISTWSNRSLATSSAFSAIGFNRVGDVALAGIVATYGITTYSFFSDSAISSLMLSCFLLVCTFKSVVATTWLWLPEAMEGPTPVSSLLHSCTLVMAGIFAVYAVPSLPGSFSDGSAFMISMATSLLLVSLLPRLEKDAKRTIAGSTVVMVGVIFLLLLGSFSTTAFLVALFHAGYKSCIFLVVGKILSHSSVYADNTTLSRSFTSPLITVVIFLIGFKSSAYSAAKHAVDAVVVEAASDFLLTVVLSTGTILLWVLGIRLSANVRRPEGISANDLAIFSMVSTLFFAGSWVIAGNNASYVQSSTFALLLFGCSVMSLPLLPTNSSISLRSTRLINPNIGNVAWATDFVGTFSSRYPAVRSITAAGAMLASPIFSAQTGSLVATVVLSAVVFVILQVCKLPSENGYFRFDH